MFDVLRPSPPIAGSAPLTADFTFPDQSHENPHRSDRRFCDVLDHAICAPWNLVAHLRSGRSIL
jgi:hypothetical protein